MSRDSVTAGNGELTEFTVHLINPLSSVFSGNLVATPENGAELVSKNKTPVELQSGESYYVSIKFIMPKRMTSNQTGRLRITLQDNNGKTEQEKFFSFTVAASQSVSLFTETRELLLKRTLDSLHIPVRLSNTGNTDQRVLVVASFPSVIKRGSNLQKIFVLPAFHDTIIYFHKRISSDMFKTDGFLIAITGLYFGGDAFGSQAINAQPAKSMRFYVENKGYATDFDNNTLTLAAQGLGTDNEWYQLLSSGSVDINKQKIYYNLDASLYKQSSGQGVQLRNTYLTYRKDDWGVIAGNIGRNYDINISGRGLVAFMDDSAHTHYAEAGYVDKSQNLLGERTKNIIKPGNAAWASYTYNRGNLTIQTAGVYDVSPYVQAKTMLLANEVRWVTPQKYIVKGILNYGIQNSMVVKDSTNNGIGAGLNFDGTFGRLYVSSVNYLSSRYYPGTTRGVLNLNERIGWSARKVGFWTGLNYFSYSPATPPGLGYTINSRKLRIDGGVTFSIKGISFSVNPSYTDEKSNDFLAKASMQSQHLGLTMNYVSPLRNESFYLNSEGGMYKSSGLPGTFFHQKTMLNLRYKFISLNAMYQLGNFYLNEIVYSKSNRNQVILISPQFQKEILARRARIQGGISFMNSTLGGSNLQQNARVEYDYSLKIRMFAAIDRNHYSAGDYKYTNVRVGVTMKLPEMKVGGSHRGNTLEVLLFRDMNDNAVFDEGDSIATNAYVNINSMIFITGTDGIVKYKNVPDGFYRITVPPLKGWTGQDKVISALKKSMRVEVPLQKTGVVRGSISYIFNQYSYELQKSKEGVFISATNSQGVRFTAMTNEDGQFVFYLPSGEYDIDLKRENMPEEIESINTYKDVAVAPQDVFQANFVLKVKERRVETKKFVSPSVASAKP
jgi:hypothetical protein